MEVQVDQMLTYLIEKPCTEDHLYEVVNNEHSPKVHRFPAVHDPGTEYLYEVGIAETDCQCGERTAHQQPVIHTWICNHMCYLHCSSELDDKFM